jgi:hypothetical protein
MEFLHSGESAATMTRPAKPFKERRFWPLNPATRRHKVKRAYRRQEAKKAVRESMEGK